MTGNPVPVHELVRSALCGVFTVNMATASFTAINSGSLALQSNYHWLNGGLSGGDYATGAFWIDVTLAGLMCRECWVKSNEYWLGSLYCMRIIMQIRENKEW